MHQSLGEGRAPAVHLCWQTPINRSSVGSTNGLNRVLQQPIHHLAPPLDVHCRRHCTSSCVHLSRFEGSTKYRDKCMLWERETRLALLLYRSNIFVHSPLDFVLQMFLKYEAHWLGMHGLGDNTPGGMQTWESKCANKRRRGLITSRKSPMSTTSVSPCQGTPGKTNCALPFVQWLLTSRACLRLAAPEG